MSKKHAFLRFFSKIALFACVFCAVPAWSETTCDIDYTPVTGNSIQNGTPTPTTPVEIESVGTKVGNKYQVSITAQGKNLFDIENAIWGENIGEDGTESSSQYNSHSDYIECKPNTTYTVSWVSNTTASAAISRYHEYDSDKTWLRQIATYSSSGRGEKNITFTTGATAKYIRFTFRGASLSETDLSTNIQLEQGSTATPYAPYGHSTTPIYLNAPLRKIGDYADILDYKKGQIVRNVGVKVFDGTETVSFYSSSYSDIYDVDSNLRDAYRTLDELSSHYTCATQTVAASMRNNQFLIRATGRSVLIRDNRFTTTEDFKSYLAAQYANGTPVTVYYPLATPVVEQIENWPCTPPITDIKIATTKYVDDEFAPLNTALTNAISVVDNVVTQTIAQAGQIATLQNTKQTRPDDDNECPAGKKCLLVTDESGTPHWYPIIEP